MECRYGEFTDEQFAEFKKKLHSKVHWFLIYKEHPEYACLDDYFENTLRYFCSLNNLLNDNPDIIELLTVLQIARDEAAKADCDFRLYRKNVFEAHKIIDRL